RPDPYHHGGACREPFDAIVNCSSTAQTVTQAGSTDAKNQPRLNGVREWSMNGARANDAEVLGARGGVELPAEVAPGPRSFQSTGTGCGPFILPGQPRGVRRLFD